MDKPIPGQRWISESEPDLGLGTLLSYGFGKAEIFFPACEEVREYATQSAPIRRVSFTEGEVIRTSDGKELIVQGVSKDDDGLLIYCCGEREVGEADLFDRMSFSRPGDRLIAGRVDHYLDYRLRIEALRQKSLIAGSEVRGMVGGKIDLIPHQLSIAAEVSSRLNPRVLLADEVGLGKTIEACLIMQRLHLTHRADRILILLPEPLIHQWFVELLRRFNMLFALFDEERCVSIESKQDGVNPFLDSQLVICATDYLVEYSNRADQVIDAGWDLVIVDEAHHLEWSPQTASPAYQVVERLAVRAAGILLLTATPQQLGPEGHFARLRLLDPARYSDLAEFLEESEHYTELAGAIDTLLAGKCEDFSELEKYAQRSSQVAAQLRKYSASGDDPKEREALVETLLDTVGTGRIMFRNTRSNLSGFPERIPRLYPIDGKHATGAPAEGDESNQHANLGITAKIDWLAEIVCEYPEEKFLLICRSRALVGELADELQNRVAVDLAQFHEGLTLLQRDRNAAFFADPDGARVLICSEIGSEGRNFQFAHHLILFDVPEDPELLEQRIGRLDRIGQTSKIYIHCPFLLGSGEEVMVRWYHEGLNALEENLHGATEISRVVADELVAAVEDPSEEKIQRLIERSKEIKHHVGERLEKGHDRLLELNSNRSGEAAATIEAIEQWDSNPRFETFFLRLLDFYGLEVNDLDDHSFLVTGNEQLTNKLPAIPDEGMALTFSREIALRREDFHFASIDHPILQGGLDTLLSSEAGNANFVVWEAEGEKALFLEAHAVIETIAPPSLHLDRFLPATPVRLAIDHQLRNRSQDELLSKAKLRGGNIHNLLQKPRIKEQVLPKMIKRAEQLAGRVAEKLAERAVALAHEKLDAEVERLVSLAQHNPGVSVEEIKRLEEHRSQVLELLPMARARLDSVRLIFKQPRTSTM